MRLHVARSVLRCYVQHFAMRWLPSQATTSSVNLVRVAPFQSSSWMDQVQGSTSGRWNNQKSKSWPFLWILKVTYSKVKVDERFACSWFDDYLYWRWFLNDLSGLCPKEMCMHHHSSLCVLSRSGAGRIWTTNPPFRSCSHRAYHLQSGTSTTVLSQQDRTSAPCL